MASILDFSEDPKKKLAQKYGAVAKKDTIFIADPKEFKLRNQAYADSSYAFNNFSTDLSPDETYKNIKNAQVYGAEVPYKKPKKLTDSDKDELLKYGAGYKGIAPVEVMLYDSQADKRNWRKNLNTSFYSNEGRTAEPPWYKDPTQVPVFQEKPEYVDPFTIAAKKIQEIPIDAKSRVLDLPDINYINQQEIAMNQPPKPVSIPQTSKPSGAAIQGQRRPDYGRQIRNAAGEKSTRAKLIDLVYDEQGNVRDKKMYGKYKNEIAKMNADENYLMNLAPLPDGNLTDADWNKNEAPMPAKQEVAVEKQPEQIVPTKSTPEATEQIVPTKSAPEVIEKKQDIAPKTSIGSKFKDLEPITELDLLLEISKPEPLVEEMDADGAFADDSERSQYIKRAKKYKDEENKRVISLKKVLAEAKSRNDITTIEKVSEALNTIKKLNDNAEAKKPYWIQLKKKREAEEKAKKDKFQKLTDEENAEWGDIKLSENLDKYKPTWFSKNEVTSRYGAPSTPEAEKLRIAAKRVLNTADVSADELRDWFSRGKGFDMLKKSVAEDLAWEKGIDVKDVPEKEIYDATMQNIANRTSRFQNAKLEFNETESVKGDTPLAFVQNYFKGNELDRLGESAKSLPLDKRKQILSPYYHKPIEYEDAPSPTSNKLKTPILNIPESVLKSKWLEDPSYGKMANDFYAGKISDADMARKTKELYIAGASQPQVIRHEVRHLADAFMPKSDRQFIQKILSEIDPKDVKFDPDDVSYLSDPLEVMARIDQIRKLFAKKKEETNDKTDFETASPNVPGAAYFELKAMGLKDEQILKIMNKVSAVKPKGGKSLMDAASA
jgi:hypothetical protein